MCIYLIKISIAPPFNNIFRVGCAAVSNGSTNPCMPYIQKAKAKEQKSKCKYKYNQKKRCIFPYIPLMIYCLIQCLWSTKCCVIGHAEFL